MVRRIYAAMSVGDTEAVREALTREFFADFSRRPMDSWALPPAEALAAFLSQIGEAWERPPVWEPEEILDADDKVAALIRTTARGKASEAEVEARVWNVWTFREGKPVDLTYFGEDRSAALAAAGLSE